MYWIIVLTYLVIFIVGGPGSGISEYTSVGTDYNLGKLADQRRIGKEIIVSDQLWILMKYIIL